MGPKKAMLAIMIGNIKDFYIFPYDLLYNMKNVCTHRTDSRNDIPKCHLKIIVFTCFQYSYTLLAPARQRKPINSNEEKKFQPNYY